MENKRLNDLRKVLALKKVTALIIPTTDPHQSEYIADYWKCREWLTGFSGSAGVAIVTQNKAQLWTDSRYFIQAEKELIEPFKLHKQLTKQPEYFDWLYKHLKSGDSIGYDAQLFPTATIEFYSNKFKTKKIEFINIDDVFNTIWENRPELVKNAIYEHEVKYCGLSTCGKINDLYAKLDNIGATNFIATKLDDIAWLLNIRGSDIAYNPLATAYFLISDKVLKLFIHKQMLTPQLETILINDGFELFNYEDITKELARIKPGSKVATEKASTNQALINALPVTCELIDKANLISYPKAIKNKIEIKNYRNAQLRDSLAMCGFLHWLENNFDKSKIDEISAADKLAEFRKAQDLFMGLSFGTISAFGKNGALPHYSVNDETNCQLDDSNLYLVDSGGQYLDGTTDITRTICLGIPSNKQKTDFTLVLKGHIKLANAIFPKGTKGYQLDTLTREALWEQGKDFGHGAGHGIGYFSNVHEGPQGFSKEANGPAGTPLAPGMLTTNEPGYYLEGEYGIRIENVLLCAEYNEHFLCFETINFCPIDTGLIDTNLLDESELEWINTYHKKTYTLLAPKLTEELKNWLKEKTKGI